MRHRLLAARGAEAERWGASPPGVRAAPGPGCPSARGRRRGRLASGAEVTFSRRPPGADGFRDFAAAAGGPEGPGRGERWLRLGAGTARGPGRPARGSLLWASRPGEQTPLLGKPFADATVSIREEKEAVCPLFRLKGVYVWVGLLWDGAAARPRIHSGRGRGVGGSGVEARLSQPLGPAKVSGAFPPKGRGAPFPAAALTLGTCGPPGRARPALKRCGCALRPRRLWNEVGAGLR